MLKVIVLSVAIYLLLLNVIMLSVAIVFVIMLSVVAPNYEFVEPIISLIGGGLPFSQTVGSSLRTQWPAKPAQKLI